MIKRYSFLKHPFYFVLENSKEMISGLDKCVAVFFDPIKDEHQALSYQKDITELVIENEAFFKELRKANKKTNWIKADQVNFNITQNKSEQLSFTDEENNSVLELRFFNPHDKKYDILYFYFKTNISNFKPVNSSEAMAVTIKEVIQNLLHNQIEILVNENYTNNSIHHNISRNTIDFSLADNIKKLEQEKFVQAKHFYNYLLNQLTLSEESEFVLTNETILNLQNNNLSTEQVNQILANSIEVIINKYPYRKFYEIKPYDLTQVNTNKEQRTIRQINLSKTTQFLNKYEDAAKRANSKNLKLTGLNIGEHCSPPISPAAISDILKKHQKKINQLLTQHPDKWLTIRKGFKPLINIVEKNRLENTNNLIA